MIRVWEKRYATVRPERSGGNQRLYSEADVERLSLLKRAVDAGHSIGTVASLAVEQLQQLVSGSSVREVRPETPLPLPRAKSMVPVAASFVDDAFEATARMDAAALERVLDQASVSLGQMALLSQVISPLVQRVGEAWREGTLMVAHEHLASAVVRTFLGHVARPLALHSAAPNLVATTPAGQLHELGAVLAAACATAHGWRVTYLGASLPAEEIVNAARQCEARAVALSLVHPEDDPALPPELARLRRLLPAHVAILAGGRAVGAYQKALAEIGAVTCGSLNQLADALDQLRQGRN